MTDERFAEIRRSLGWVAGFVAQEYDNRSYSAAEQDPYVACARVAVDSVRDLECALAEIDRLRAENERARDLVRYARQFLHEEELISDREYGELCADHGPERVARLQTYDKMRADLAAERKRAELWKAECAERAMWIEESWQEGNYCPSCGLVVDEHVPHCPLVRLMTMPEEPKP